MQFSIALICSFIRLNDTIINQPAVLLLGISLVKIFILLQLNISGCDCAPTDCEKTTVAFQQLQQSTKHCFADFNYPINDVAKKILNDAEYLRTVIEQLYKQNSQSQANSEAQYSFKPKIIEKTVKVENKWCHY